MDYESLSARALQQACRDRGLPTARDKDTMISRLVEADAADREAPPGDDDVLQPEAVPASSSQPGPVPAPAVTPAVWRERYPAGEQLADGEHQANCANVAAAAVARGYTTLGSGRRVGTVDGCHVYEVYLRRGGTR